MPSAMHQRTIAGLGWKPDLPDPRDHLFSAPGPVLQALPPSADLTPVFPVYSQGRIGSCTANALAGAVQYDRIRDGQAPDFVPSRLFVYYNERDVEGSVANDSGAYLRDGIKTLASLGVCSETIWPYDDTPPLGDGGSFPAGSLPAKKPSDDAYAQASGYQILEYARLQQTLSQLQACLASGRPFVFGFSVFSGWYNQRPFATNIPLPAGDDWLVGGHAVLCVGYDNETNLFKIRNSWGPTEGDSGYFYMPYAYLTDPNLAKDFWVIRSVEA